MVAVSENRKFLNWPKQPQMLTKK